MPIGILKEKFGRSSNDFKSVEEIDNYISEKFGKELPIKVMRGDLVSSRGCIMPIEESNAGELFDKVMKKHGLK